MFLDFYRLREQPFGPTPNPRFLYETPSHREALASLRYAVANDLGFAALVAPPGMGKTTLLFELLESLRDTARTAFVFQTQCEFTDLLRHLLLELDLPADTSDPVQLHERLKQFLVTQARERRRVVIVIDEAQDLPAAGLEALRLLSNFETPEAKLVQFVLSGQVEFAERLQESSMAQLQNRMASISHLLPLTREQVDGYIRHRLEVAGHPGDSLFTTDAVDVVTASSKGIPRNINRLCFNAMSLGFALERPVITADIVHEAAHDLSCASLEHRGAATAAIAAPPNQSQVAGPLSAANASTAAPRKPAMRPQIAPRPANRAFAGNAVAARPAVVAAPTRTPRAPTPAARVAPAPSVAPPQRFATKQKQPKTRRARHDWVSWSLGIACVALGLLLSATLLLPNGQTTSAGSVTTSSSATNPAATHQAVSDKDAAPPAEAEPATGTLPDSDQPGVASPDSTHVRSRRERPETVPAKANSDETSTPPPSAMALPSPLTSAPHADAAMKAPAAADVAPPALPLMARSDSNATGSVLAIYAPAIPTKPPAPDLKVLSPRLLRDALPVYPAEAKQAGVQGDVVLEASIDPQGHVGNVHAIDGNPLLRRAAIDALRRWHYEPAFVGGHPVPSQLRVTMKFHLPPR